MFSALTYQEMLRTLGALLDDAGCRTAVIRLSRQGAEVIAPRWKGPRVWTAQDLRDAAARQRRGRASWRAPTTPRKGWGSHLRALGAHLDTLRGGSYVLTVQADVVRVQATSGDEQTFPLEALGRRARLLPQLRDQAAGAG
jgi:hypothetical protein